MLPLQRCAVRSSEERIAKAGEQGGPSEPSAGAPSRGAGLRGYVVLAAACVFAALLLPGAAGAQKADVKAPDGDKKGPTSTIEACGEFRNAAKFGAKADGKAPPEAAQLAFGRLANAGQFGIGCAKALSKHFENLRKEGGRGTWAEIEKELDMVMGTFRDLIVQIEGADGVYEQGKRAVSLLAAKATDITASKGENHVNAIAARKEQELITGGLEKTKKLTVSLVVALDQMAVRKADIAEAIGIQRYAAARQALDNLNEGLTQVVEELAREAKKTTVRTPGG